MLNEERLVLGRNLAQAVLLFHKGGAWTEADSIKWKALTGTTEATTVNLCSLANRYIAELPATLQLATCQPEGKGTSDA